VTGPTTKTPSWSIVDSISAVIAAEALALLNTGAVQVIAYRCHPTTKVPSAKVTPTPVLPTVKTPPTGTAVSSP
jgi:hypothetical protein